MAVFVNRPKLGLGGCEGFIMGGGDVIVGAYRRTLQMEAAAAEGISTETKPAHPAFRAHKH